MAFNRSGGDRAERTTEDSSAGLSGLARVVRWIRRGLYAVLAMGVLALIGGAAVYWAFLTDLPDLERIDDYRPPLTSRVLDREGRLAGEFFVERRRLVPIDQIPDHAKLAFVAAEDSAFFEHAGIDYVSILRAAWVDISAGEIRQGASTITMQLVKQLLLTPERAFRRKIREMVLAQRLEQHFTKQEILYLYLNHIYFGHGANGIGEAAYTYFDKPVSELSVAEAALLAGLPQRPSAYSPYRNPEAAEIRRHYVLGRMLADAVIDQAQFDAAQEPPELRPPEERERAEVAAYFAEEVRRYLFERIGGERVLEDGLVIETTLDLELQAAASAAVRKGLLDHDRRQGYRGPIRQVPESEVFLEAEKLAEENGLREQTEEGLEEELAATDPEPLLPADALEADAAIMAGAGEQEPGDEEGESTAAPQLPPTDEAWLAVVTDVDPKAQTAQVAFAPELQGIVRLKDVEWARKPDPGRPGQPIKQIGDALAVGDVARFLRVVSDEEEPSSQEGEESEAPLYVSVAQEPIVQGALFSVDVESGDILAMVGGYDFEASEFNRATQGKRQPGSAFKPFIYGAALTRGYTPVATLYDRPVVYEDPVSGFVWRPQNYSRVFFGPIPMRNALVRSVNNATVHLFRDVGVDFVIDFARRLGIGAPLNRDLSLALGSSSLTLSELTTAYGVFPNRGRRVVPRFITRVTDRDGTVLLEDIPLGNPPAPVSNPLADPKEEVELVYPEGEALPTDRIISEAAAYLMCDLLKAVVVDPKGTGWRLRKLGRPLAGKTGTTNDQFDAWFVGFSPQVVTGVWVGHDESRYLGHAETGSRAAAPIWVDYMREALKDRPVRDFEVPEGIVFHRIDRATGLLADTDSADAYFQPFLEDTQPTQSSRTASSASDSRRALLEDAF